MRSADLQASRLPQTTAPASVVSAPRQGSEPSTADGWVLYTVWARWSAASVRVRSLLQQLVQDRALPVSVVDLDVDQDPEAVRMLGVTVVPSLVLVRDRCAVSHLRGEVGAINVKPWLQTFMDTV